MRCITRTKCKTNDKNPTTKEISYSISGKGKSQSYEYGKLYPGRYTYVRCLIGWIAKTFDYINHVN